MSARHIDLEGAMKHFVPHDPSRRTFFAGASALCASGLLGLPEIAAADPPPEISKIRIVHTPVVCFAPIYIAAELLRLEGFSEVEYVKPRNEGNVGLLTAGGADIAMAGATAVMLPIDAGQPAKVLAGMHAGCWELMASERVRTIKDLKGKTVAVTGIGSLDHVFIASMMAYVGMDPRVDVKWLITERLADSMRAFAEGQADALLAFAQQPVGLRARKVGRTLINTTLDRPWSQYFCCVAIAHPSFIQQYPIAAKRALRAFLKAADVCSQEPERVARLMKSMGHASEYETILEVLKSLPYDVWRRDEPADTLRFHALRLYEVGMIKSTPQKLIAQGTDWRFLNELKQELKA
jgi:NitT/TauT family transport system substrate-binding protein